MRAALAVVALALCGYGYGPEEDPFVRGWKLVAAAANDRRWAQAELERRQLDPAVAEIRAGLGRDPGAPLDAALRARDAAGLARSLTALAWLAIEWKLESSRRESLAQYYAAKYRVEAARGYYAELLAPALRRRGDARFAALHARAWQGFDDARAALGRPGFLGRGVEPPDPAAYDAARARIRDALLEAFPFLPEVSP